MFFSIHLRSVAREHYVEAEAVEAEAGLCRLELLTARIPTVCLSDEV